MYREGEEEEKKISFFEGDILQERGEGFGLLGGCGGC